jgi:hypothetical protein
MAAGLRRLLLEQTDMVWQQAHQCVDGLTDEEFFWEPAPGCWSLRRRSELTVDVAPAELAVPGDWICEYIGGHPQPPPLTTIAWRVTHTMLAVWSYIDDIIPREMRPEPELPYTAATAVAKWADVLAEYRAAIASYDDEELAASIPAWDLELTRSFLVNHAHREVLHHSAEVGCMRDLYRALHRGA